MLFGNPSLMTRIAIGKGVGFVIGIAGFIVVPFLWPEAGWPFRFGILFWYATVGAIIGVYGVVTWHPVLHLPMPWWVRAPIIGAWMNLLLVLMAQTEIATMMNASFGAGTVLANPYWLVLEGAMVGAVIGLLCTKFGGEGKDTVDVVTA